jgi:hypothetical protein
LLLLEAIGAFRSHYGDDLRHVNDDTTVIRWIAGRERIRISPSFACGYEARESLPAFVRHAFHRGTVFVDGHLRTESRFALPAALFFPVSALATVALARRPSVGVGLVAAGALGAGGVALAAGAPPHEARGFALLTPVYAAAHGLGMWRGLALLLRHRGARGAS